MRYPAFVAAVAASALIGPALPTSASDLASRGVAPVMSSTSRVKHVEITRREPFAGGMAFGDVGAYEKLVGTATLELDLEDPRNAPILDAEKVPGGVPGTL